MAAILAFLAALSFGGADFLCGLASRRSTVPAVLLVSQAAGALAALVAAPLLGGGLPAASDLAWGALAGSLGMVGLSALYAGIASGHAALVSPLSALLSALVPLVFALATGERVTATGAAGMALCVPAILLLTLPERGATEPGSDGSAPVPAAEGPAGQEAAAAAESAPAAAKAAESRSRPLMLALVAGLLLGGFYIAISRSSRDSGLWPLFGARMASMSLTSILVLTGRLRFSFRRPDLGASLAGGLLDMSANAAFLVASRLGALGIASVLTSLYPAPTVVLAAVFFRERITWKKAAGLVLAIAGAALAGLR